MRLPAACCPLPAQVVRIACLFEVDGSAEGLSNTLIYSEESGGAGSTPPARRRLMATSLELESQDVTLTLRHTEEVVTPPPLTGAEVG